MAITVAATDWLIFSTQKKKLFPTLNVNQPDEVVLSNHSTNVLFYQFIFCLNSIHVECQCFLICRKSLLSNACVSVVCMSMYSRANANCQSTRRWTNVCVCLCACKTYLLSPLFAVAVLYFILFFVFFLFFIHYGCFNCFGAVAVLAVVAPGFNVCLCYCSSCLVSHLVARHVRTAAAAATADQHPATFLLCGANGNGTSASVAILQLALSAYAMERIQRGENNCKEERKTTTKIAIQSDNNKSNSSSSHKQNTRRGKLFYLLNAVGMVDACCCFRWGAHSHRNVRTIRVWRIERLNAIGWTVGQNVAF